MNKSILITGANGQLGQELIKAFEGKDGFSIIATDVDTLDITDESAIQSLLKSHKIDFLVNCAAFTAVDRAESDTELCHKLNADAPGFLAKAAAIFGAKMIHISTDYVFDGNSSTPYNELSEPNPVTTYGKTKLEGEINVRNACPDAIIIRTAWLYSVHGKNFVKTMLNLANKGQQLKVVNDQIGTPTSATDLAHAIAQVISSEHWQPGIYHYTDEGVTSWYDFAKAITHIAGIKSLIEPCSSEQYPTPARRPHYSVLDKSLIKNTFNLIIPHWYDALVPVVNQLTEQEQANNKN